MTSMSYTSQPSSNTMRHQASSYASTQYERQRNILRRGHNRCPISYKGKQPNETITAHNPNLRMEQHLPPSPTPHRLDRQRDSDEPAMVGREQVSLYKWRWSKQRVFLHSYSEGIKYECERIIKLLEEAEPCECNPSWSYRCDTHFRIALIKGDNK